MDLLIGISYDADIKLARQVILNTVHADERILANPAPEVLVKELADSSVNLSIRSWVLTPDYWKVYFSLMENIKVALDENGISIPFPQRELHIYRHGGSEGEGSEEAAG